MILLIFLCNLFLNFEFLFYKFLSIVLIIYIIINLKPHGAWILFFSWHFPFFPLFVFMWLLSVIAWLYFKPFCFFQTRRTSHSSFSLVHCSPFRCSRYACWPQRAHILSLSPSVVWWNDRLRQPWCKCNIIRQWIFYLKI